MLWQANGVQMNYRNPKLLKLADGAPCMMCSIQDGTVVAAHSNQLRDGKGTGIKGHDFRIAFLCVTCHNMIDNGNKLSKEERIQLFEHAHRATIGWLFLNNHLGVK
jgi:hypothetical protein